MTPDLFADALLGVLGCAHDALDANGRPVALAHLAPGAQVAWDNCCADDDGGAGGQLWVRLIDVYPTNPFPTEDLTQLRCQIVELAARIGVGVMRCAHTVDDSGTAPTAEEMTGDTLNTTADASILAQALVCCAPQVRQVRSLKLAHWTPQGPSGGCVGGEWEALVALDWCGCQGA